MPRNSDVFRTAIVLIRKHCGNGAIKSSIRAKAIPKQRQTMAGKGKSHKDRTGKLVEFGAIAAYQ